MRKSVNRSFYLVSLLLSVPLSGCSVLEIFSSSESETPPAELVEFEPSLEVKTLWSKSVGEGTAEHRVKLEPFVYQGRVFVADREGEVKALDAVTGEEIWGVDTGQPFSGGPGVGEGLVVLGSTDAEVVALDESTGEQVWRVPVSSEVLSVPQVGQGMAVVQTIDGKVVALEIDTGESVWFYERTVPVLTLRGSSSPVIDGNRVICGFASGKLAALDLASGQPLWETTVTTPSGRSELERMVDIDADPVVRDDVVYVVTFQGDLAGVSLDTGVVLWRHSVSSYAGLSVDWREIYVTDAEDSVWAVDLRSGSAAWKQQKLQGRNVSAPAILGDYIVVGDFEGYLHWLHYEDGHMVARSRVGGTAISAKPKVDGDIVYVFGDSGDLAALTLATEERRSLQP